MNLCRLVNTLTEMAMSATFPPAAAAVDFTAHPVPAAAAAAAAVDITAHLVQVPAALVQIV